jgi:prevent-host-death family protein
MTSVGIREAKTHFSRLLKQVREGKEVLITDHGRAVGKLVPVPSGHGSLEELENDLELRGVIEKRVSTRPLPPAAKAPAGIAQRLLREDRDG